MIRALALALPMTGCALAVDAPRERSDDAAVAPVGPLQTAPTVGTEDHAVDIYDADGNLLPSCECDPENTEPCCWDCTVPRCRVEGAVVHVNPVTDDFYCVVPLENPIEDTVTHALAGDAWCPDGDGVSDRDR